MLQTEVAADKQRGEHHVCTIYGGNSGCWLIAVASGCLLVSVIITMASVREQRLRLLDSFEATAQLRVSTEMQAFHDHFPEVDTLRVALGGEAQATYPFGCRPLTSESVADRITKSNPGSVSGVGFAKEVDRVHLGPLADILAREYANSTRFKFCSLRAIGTRGLLPLSAANQTQIRPRRALPLTMVGDFNGSTANVIGLDLSTNLPRYQAMEAAALANRIAVTRPLQLASRTGLTRGVLVTAPVYSTLGTRSGDRLVNLPDGIDVQARAGDEVPGINRITGDYRRVQQEQYTHNASDPCGEAFRAVCLPFTSAEDALAAYNQSLIDVQEGRREHPLEPCSSRCVNGHLFRGHAVAIFFFAAISKEADLVRDLESPVALYSEDVTDLVLEAQERLSDGAGGLTGEREREYDDYAYAVATPYFYELSRVSLFDLFSAGTKNDATMLTRHDVSAGLGYFYYALNDASKLQDPASDETQEQVLGFVHGRASGSTREVLGYLVPVGNRVWSIHVAVTDEFFQSHSTSAVLIPIVFGGLMTVAVTALVAVGFAATRAYQLRDNRERSEQKARFEAAYKAHEIMVSFVVHEQRNPLHLCSGSLSMLKEASVSVGNATKRAMAVLEGALVENMKVSTQCQIVAHHLLQAAEVNDRSGIQSDGTAAAASGSDPRLVEQVKALQALGSAKRSLHAGHQKLEGAAHLLKSVYDQIKANDGDLSVIHQGTETLHRLVNDLLDLSRLHQGKLPIAPAPIDPRKLIATVASSHQSFAEVPLRFNVSASVPLVIVADELRITQILANGLTNAAKFCRKGYILVDLRVEMRPMSRPVAEEDIQSSRLARIYGEAVSTAHQGSAGSNFGPGSLLDAASTREARMLQWIKHHDNAVSNDEDGPGAVYPDDEKTFQAAGDEETKRTLGMVSHSESPRRGMCEQVSCGCGPGRSMPSSTERYDTTAADLRYEQLDSCIELCGGSREAGIELLTRIGAAGNSSLSSLGEKVAKAAEEVRISHGIIPEGGAVAAAMATVPSAVDTLLPPGLLLSGPRTDGSIACPPEYGVVGPGASLGFCGISLNHHSYMALMLSGTGNGDSVEYNDDLASDGVAAQQTSQVAPDALPSPTVVPMLVFRVIDTGAGLARDPAGSSKNELFSAFVTREVSAPENSQDQAWIRSDNEQIGIGSEARDDSAVPFAVGSTSGVSNERSTRFNPTAPDGSASSVAKQKGSGLGLAMAEELTKQMGGTIGLGAEYRKKRTVLEVSLPLRPPWRVVRRMETGAASKLRKGTCLMWEQRLRQEMQAIGRACELLSQGKTDAALAECSCAAIAGREAFGPYSAIGVEQRQPTTRRSVSSDEGILAASTMPVEHTTANRRSCRSPTANYGIGEGLHRRLGDSTASKNATSSFSLRVGSIEPSSRTGNCAPGITNDATHAPDRELERRPGETPFDDPVNRPACVSSNANHDRSLQSSEGKRYSRRDTQVLRALEEVRSSTRAECTAGAEACLVNTLKSVSALDYSRLSAILLHMRSFSGQFDAASRRSEAGNADESVYTSDHQRRDMSTEGNLQSLTTPSRLLYSQGLSHRSIGDLCDDTHAWGDVPTEPVVVPSSARARARPAASAKVQHSHPNSVVSCSDKGGIGNTTDQGCMQSHDGCIVEEAARELVLPYTRGHRDSRTAAQGAYSRTAAQGASILPRIAGNAGVSCVEADVTALGATAQVLRRAFERGMHSAEVGDSLACSNTSGPADFQARDPRSRSMPGRDASLSAGGYEGCRSLDSALPLAGDSTSGPLSGLHVLVVDDERALRRMASRMLTRLGATCEELEDGEECEAVLKSKGQLPGSYAAGTRALGCDHGASEAGPQFDVILSDIVMVHSRGTDVCKHLLELGCRVPIFAMTANHDAWNLPEYRAAGFYGILPKPYSQSQLLQKLADLRGSGTIEAVRAEQQRWARSGSVAVQTVEDLWANRDRQLYPGSGETARHRSKSGPSYSRGSPRRAISGVSGQQPIKDLLAGERAGGESGPLDRGPRPTRLELSTMYPAFATQRSESIRTSTSAPPDARSRKDRRVVKRREKRKQET